MLSSALCVTRSSFTYGDGLERLRLRSAGISSNPRRYVVIKFSRCAGGAKRSKELEDLKILRRRTSTEKKTESSESGEVSVVEDPKSARRTVGNTSRPYIVPPRRVRSKEMVLKLAKGFRGNKNIRIARGRVRRALEYAYRDRRTRKRDFRRLWITRINAAARLHGLSYVEFIHGLNLQKVEVNRKALAQIAVLDSEGFKKVAELTKQFKEGLKVETSNTL